MCLVNYDTQYNSNSIILYSTTTRDDIVAPPYTSTTQTYILGDGLLHKRSYSQQKLDQLRKSQVFHIMQG